MTLRVALWGLAFAAALVPLPAAFVERVYSRGIYPTFQPAVTLVSNMVPVALLDIALGVLLIAVMVRYARGIRRRGWRQASVALLVSLVSLAAVTYLLFLASWGYNYRRIPLEAKLDFDRSRISREAAITLAKQSVTHLNAGHASAHAHEFRPDIVEYALASTHLALGGDEPPMTGRPKRSIFGFYFRQAAIDGMTVPVFLEIILNPDLLPVERPSVLLHEWAHLAGYADESEANFVAWISGVRSEDPVARYSAWLDAYRLAAGTLPRGVRAGLPPLDPGPRADLIAMAARYDRSSPAVRNAARGAYDSYLKANRIEEGIANYGMVLQLMLGTSYDPAWKPRLR
jgi:hypothetical protein